MYTYIYTQVLAGRKLRSGSYFSSNDTPWRKHARKWRTSRWETRIIVHAAHFGADEANSKGNNTFRTRTHIGRYLRIYSRNDMYTLILTHAHTHTHICAYAYIHTHFLLYLSLSHTHTHTQAHAQTQTQAHSHTHTHTRTHTHTHTHAHTHTHTHTPQHKHCGSRWSWCARLLLLYFLDSRV